MMLLTPADPVARRVRDERLLRDSRRSRPTSPASSRNKFPTDAIRGAGRPEATHMIEVAMDQLAAELGMDPLEVRRRNFIPADDFPSETAARHRLRLRQLPGHAGQAARAPRLRRRSAPSRSACAARASTAASASPPTPRSAAWRRRASSAPAASACRPAAGSPRVVRVHPTGTVTVFTGTSPHGQGHETGFAQIVADRARRRPRAGRGHPRRHRPGPERPGHLRVALAGRRRRVDRARGRQGRREGQDRSSPTSSRPRPRTSSSRRASSSVQRLARPGA